MKVSYIKDERIHCQHTCATRNAKNYSSRRQMTTDGNTDIQKDSENVQYMGKYKMYHFSPSISLKDNWLFMVKVIAFLWGLKYM